VLELYDPANGRLDARCIAEFYGVLLADVAQAIDVSLSRLQQTPPTSSIQAGLFLFERIAYALLLLVGSQENARIWLNLPEAQLNDQIPMTFLREGRGHIVAQMLDDMLNGQPS
jgi:uncharacterized protein (DUF2384 family)